MRINLAATAIVASLLVISGAPVQAQTADEIALLKQQLAELQQKLAVLEAKQQAQETLAAASAKPTADVLAEVRSAVSFSGDVRYRHETFDVEYVDKDRSRQRIRARLTADFRVNETLKGAIRLATGGDDPRSANATLTGSNARKDFGLDLAYLEWSPVADWKFTAGKMKYVWSRTPSFFYDNDVNPEGLAANYSRGNFFASSFYHWLTERALSFSNPTAGNSTDSTLLGGQVGWKGDLADGTALTLSASYLDFGGVEGYNPFYAGNAFGNTTTTSAAVCRKAISTCLLSDFNVVVLSGELTTSLAGRPLRAYFDLAQNTGAVSNPVAGKKLDSAYALGFVYGRASGAGTWEFGTIYQNVEKDALFGQLVDSNFGDGNTDADGLVFAGAYAPARNWTISGRFFLNRLYNDVPITLTLLSPTTTNPNATAARSVSERDYKRLQIDLNFKF